MLVWQKIPELLVISCCAGFWRHFVSLVVLPNAIDIPSLATCWKGLMLVSLLSHRVLVLLRHMRWKSAGILFKLYLHSILCLLVRLVKWMFLKIQLLVLAITDVPLGGTYELTRRLTVPFSPLKSCMRPYYHSPFIDSRGRSWLWCTCSECKLREMLQLLYFAFYFRSSVSNLPEAIAVRNNCTVKSTSPNGQISCRLQILWKWMITCFYL